MKTREQTTLTTYSDPITSTLYSTKVTATGGRHGQIRSEDGLLDMKLALPRQLSGKGDATNPETLFAGGYAACFENALLHVSRDAGLRFADGDVEVTAEVGLSRNDSEGETEAANGKKFPNDSKPLIKTPDGFVFLDPANFATDFAADLPREQAEFMAHSQMLTAAKVFTTPITNPAWKLKPSWYLVAKDDKTIKPDLERMYAERAHSHKVEKPAPPLKCLPPDCFRPGRSGPDRGGFPDILPGFNRHHHPL